MNILRRTLIATAPAALGVLLFAGSASATTIMGSTSTSGSNGAFGAGATGSVSAGQFNQVALDAAIQAACPPGFTCSGSTLNEIDFLLTVNTTAAVTVSNTNASTALVGPIGYVSPSNPGPDNGTFGHPTSGFALAQVTTVDLSDGITDDLIDDIPTFSAATTNEAKSNTCAGTAVASAFTNCLAVAAGGQTYSGTGTDTEAGSYTGDLSGEVGTYVGAGSVSFTLGSIGGTVSGRLPTNVGIASNTATIQALVNSLTVTYDYSYTETAVSSAPEPTTMVLVGAGLLAIGMIRKKRIS